MVLREIQNNFTAPESVGCALPCTWIAVAAAGKIEWGERKKIKTDSMLPFQPPHWSAKRGRKRGFGWGFRLEVIRIPKGRETWASANPSDDESIAYVLLFSHAFMRQKVQLIAVAVACLFVCLPACCWVSGFPSNTIPFRESGGSLPWKVCKKFTWVIDYVAYHMVLSMNSSPAQISNGKWEMGVQTCGLQIAFVCGHVSFE